MDPFRPAGSTAQAPRPKKHKQAANRHSNRRRKPRLTAGQRALTPRTDQQIKNQARTVVRTAYQPAENELDVQEQKARSLYESQQSAEAQFQNWLAGQNAQMAASAAQADQAARSEMTRLRMEADARLAASQQAAQAQPQSPGSVGADQYQGAQIANAREAAAGTAGAQEARLLEAQAAGQGVAATLQSSTIAAGENRKNQQLQAFNDQLTKVADAHKDLRLRRAADVQKMITDLQARNIDVAKSNRDFEAVARELGIKGYEAVTERRNKAAKVKLERRDQRIKVRQNQIDNELRMIDLRLKERDLSRKERSDLEHRRHNLEQERQSNFKLTHPNAGGKGGSGGDDFSEGAKNRWGTIVDLASHTKRPKNVPNLLWEASRAYRNGGRLTYELTQRLMEANIGVPPRYRYRGGGTGPH